MYAIVKTGGKQYRVQQGETLLVERLPDAEGATVDLAPLLIVDGETLTDGADLATATVQAKIVAHERGPKLRIVKFKPKRGYKNRNGHRQELSRIEITSLGAQGGGSRSRAAETAEPEPAAPAEPEQAATEVSNGA